MELSYSHSHSQRILRQRNILAIVASGLCALTLLLFIFTVSRDREVVLQPILRSPVTVSSAGVSREYLEMITRSEEHTSELQSLMRISYAVFCLKKKKINKKINNDHISLNTTTTQRIQTH